MISHRLTLPGKIALILAAFLYFQDLSAQCNPPDQLPTGSCETAPLTCLNDACYETQQFNFTGYNGWCGPFTAIHNPQYFQFIPTEEFVEIDIHVDFCEDGQGLQSAILDACPWDLVNVLDCDAGTNPGGTMILTAGPLVIGQVYWLVIDGSAGALCQYTIEFTSGIYTPQIDEELDPAMTMALPDVVCQGYDNFTMVTGPPIPFAHGYYWVLGWSGDTITSTNPNHSISIPDNAPIGIWDICVRAFSGCDTTDEEVCFEVEIIELDDVEKDPETFCQEEFPFSWHGITISGEGDYSQTFETPEGCPYDSLWTVEEYPEVPEGELDTLFCMNSDFDPFIYEGEEYTNSGNYDLEYPGQGLNGCDSTAVLYLTLAGIDAFLEVSCADGQYVITALIQELIPTNAVLSFEWYVDGVLHPESTNPLEILADGVITIECIVTVSTGAGDCVFQLETLIFNTNDYVPTPPLFSHGDTLLCAQSGVFFTVADCDPILGYEYYWTGPPGVNVFDDGSCVVEMDFSFSTAGGPVCVYAVNECGEGASACFNVDIISAPVAAFSAPDELCVDSLTVITFTGSSSPNAEVIWNFDSPDSLSGSGFGPYTAGWSIPGPKAISLMVIEPGCDTAFIVDTIHVGNLLAPVVTCASTISSVMFNWNDVVGSNGYIVSYNGGPDSSLTVSEFSISGLTPGTVINLTLTTISGGACDNITVTAMCTAENCPPPMIVLSGQDSFCLNAPATAVLTAIVNGSPGTGTWSGNGIVDPVAGVFDPQVAGSGQHQLTYSVDLMGCPFSQPFLVTVFDSITADFTVDPLICITDVANLTFTGNASAGANYAYDFGGGTVVAGSGAGPYQLSFATPGLKTIRLQISENGCMSDIITQTLTVEPSLNAPVVNCQAQTSNVEFSWPDNPQVTYTVTTLSGHIGVQTGNSILFSGLVPGNIVQIEILTQSTGPCPERRDTFDCEARLCPTVGIEITPVDDICLSPATSALTLEVDVTNGNGVGDWSGPGITNTVTGTFDPGIAGPGAHPITFHYLDDGCDFIESITINVFDPPTAFVSNTSLILTCAGGNKLLLDGSGSSGGSLIFLWTTDDGVIIQGENTDKAEVGAPGRYQLKVTDTASGCVDSVSVDVTQDANTPTPCAGPDRVITCDSVSFVLGNCSSTGPNITYLWSTVGGNIVGATNGINITANEVGDYTILVRDTVNGCQSLDQVSITIDTAVAAITLTPGDTIDCNTPISGVQGSITGSITDYTLDWDTNDGEIVGSTNAIDIDVSQGGTYTLTIHHNDNGCERSASAIVAESDAIIDGIDVSAMNIRCFGEDNGTLVINGVSGGIPPYTYQWSVSQQGGDSLSLLSPGTYSLTVSDQNGCSIVRMYTLTEPDKLTVDLGPNQTVPVDDSVRINLTTNINSNAITDIEWSGYDGLDCPGCPKLEFIATSSATFMALVTDTSGCTAFDSMRLTVIVPRIIYIPNVFSPNGDGVNDYFSITGRRNLVNIGFLRIYDRWGNLVFENTDMTPGVEEEGWNGMFKGHPLQPGVYAWVARLDYEDTLTETIRGGITLVR